MERCRTSKANRAKLFALPGHIHFTKDLYLSCVQLTYKADFIFFHKQKRVYYVYYIVEKKTVADLFKIDNYHVCLTSVLNIELILERSFCKSYCTCDSVYESFMEILCKIIETV